jgi:hypothetical protein
MYTCESCTYTTTNKSNYTRHIKTVCNKNELTIGDKQFSVLNDRQVHCVICDKCILRASAKKHSCRGAPKNTCKFCGKTFNHASNINAHNKICKQNPDNQNSFSHNVFCHENLEYLRVRIHTEPRVRQVISDFGTALSLIYFNADHPENQTIRKPVKKDDMIYLRSEGSTVAKPEWLPYPSQVAIPKIRDNIERKLRIQFGGDQQNLSNRTIDSRNDLEQDERGPTTRVRVRAYV